MRFPKTLDEEDMALFARECKLAGLTTCVDTTAVGKYVIIGEYLVTKEFPGTLGQDVALIMHWYYQYRWMTPKWWEFWRKPMWKLEFGQDRSFVLVPAAAVGALP